MGEEGAEGDEELPVGEEGVGGDEEPLEGEEGVGDERLPGRAGEPGQEQERQRVQGQVLVVRDDD